MNVVGPDGAVEIPQAIYAIHHLEPAEVMLIMSEVDVGSGLDHRFGPNVIIAMDDGFKWLERRFPSQQFSMPRVTWSRKEPPKGFSQGNGGDGEGTR